MAARKDDDLYPLWTFVQELGRVRHDARLVVLVANGVIELFVNAIVEARCRNGRTITSDSRGYPLSAKLIILNEIGAMPDREFRLYDWFRRIRNRAAHDPLFEVTSGDLAHLKPKYQDPKNFHKVCEYLALGLWNANVALLEPLFMPGMKEFTRPPRRKGNPGPLRPAAELLPPKPGRPRNK